MSWLRDRIVADWREAMAWSSIRLNLAVAALSVLFQVAPALDPSIAGLLPAPLRSPAIGIYALTNLALRLTKLKGNGK